MENPNVQYYEICSKPFNINKFKYSFVDIQMDNISQSIKDESLKDAMLLKPDQYKEKYNDEKQQILYDLSLLENTSEIIN